MRVQVGFALTVKVALMPYIFSEILCSVKKIGQNSIVQVDRQNFCVSHEFAGGATLNLWPLNLPRETYNYNSHKNFGG